jgi:hypothetical protein
LCGSCRTNFFRKSSEIDAELAKDTSELVDSIGDWKASASALAREVAGGRIVADEAVSMPYLLPRPRQTVCRKDE